MLYESLEPLGIAAWAQRCSLSNLEAAAANLSRMAEDGMSPSLLQVVMERLEEELPSASDADAALNNLQRFVHAVRSPATLQRIFGKHHESLTILIRIFSISQYLADQLIRDPSYFRSLRRSDGQPVARDVLIEEICAEAETTDDEASVMRILRSYRHRETLRIAYGDYIGRLPLEKLTQQISYLADGLCEAAYRTAWRLSIRKHGVPRGRENKAARFAVLALGKLGGIELNYSSDIDLMYIAETDGTTDGTRPISNLEFFEKLSQQFTRFLSDTTSLGRAYRVDLRLRPYGASGPIVSSPSEMLKYYDQSGRTWERQAFLKARCIAGDTDLGDSFLESLQPWIYRRYLSAADISGIRALKRRIEKGSRDSHQASRDVKVGRGGIRDIEFAIQFLQLLNGSELPLIRTGNTLTAISKLQQEGCLTPSEGTILEDNYRFLRTVEHHLQIAYDHQTHTIPENLNEQRKLAIRMGFIDQGDTAGLEKFNQQLNERTELNRRILDHLLHDAFGEEQEISDETDLVLDPDPSLDRIASVLSKYRFVDIENAYRRLQELASELVPFLSSRRCRHFLAAIAEKLLAEISQTPDPDATLLNLSRVSDSIGGKAVLWELFSYHHPSMQMGIRLCAASSYLVELLTGNPGMIDELLDSLMIDGLPSRDEMNQWLNALCLGAEDIDPMLHSFKDAMHLRIGIRDLMGKQDFMETNRALAWVAEACLRVVVEREYQSLVNRYGHPWNEKEGRRANLAIVALGKLGGEDPNYHSDLDVVFLYDEDGHTSSDGNNQNRVESVSNHYFFNQLAQRITQHINSQAKYGKLYELDVRLRPSGSSGSLAITLDDLEGYFKSGLGQIWERHLLCKARVVWGTDQVSVRTMNTVHQILKGADVNSQEVQSMFDMRAKMETAAAQSNLKRGKGGTVDIEFLVQLLQMKAFKLFPKVMVPGTIHALHALQECGVLEETTARVLADGYRALRQMESGIRLMNLVARHEFPSEPAEREKLAYLLRRPSGESLDEECQQVRSAIRSIYDQFQ